MKKHPKSLLVLSAVALAACTTVPTEPSLSVPEIIQWNVTPIIQASGLEPGQIYTLTLDRPTATSIEVHYTSSLQYRADDRGRINTADAVVVGGDEKGAYLPFRTMSFVREPIEGIETGRLRVRLVSETEGLIEETQVRFGPDMDLLTETALGPDFPGAYIMNRKDSSGPQPTIVVLGGSEGGDGGSRSSAPNLALEGYTVLGLPYYSPAWGDNPAQFPDLPRDFVDIPVDYLEEAVAELRMRDDVDPETIILSGGSKGAEFVLLAGSLIPDDSPGGGFCGIVADVPTDVVWEGWGRGVASDTRSSFSWRGEPLPFVPYQDMGRVFVPDSDYTMTEAHENGRQANPQRVEAARIRVEAIDEPVFLIGGDKDETWASGPMARTIKARRDAAGLETESYTYAEASHYVGATPLRRGSRVDTKARIENYPAMMDFIKRHVQRDDCR